MLCPDSHRLQSEIDCDMMLKKLLEKKKALQQSLDSLEEEVQKFNQSKENYQTRTQQFQPILNAEVAAVNGTECVIQKAKALLQDVKNKMDNQRKKFDDVLESLQSDFKTVYEDSDNLTNVLVDKVKQWQHELQLKYAELFYTNLDLESFSHHCAETGALIRDVLRADIPRAENAFSAVLGTEYVDPNQWHGQFYLLLTSFYQRTFIVVTQEASPKHDPWNIRLSKNDKRKTAEARAPKVTLRILGADTYEGLGGVQVNACFILEGLINENFDHESGKPDITIQEKGWEIKSGKTAKFVRPKRSSIYEGSFSSELATDLKRTLPVYKDKYRLLFFTKFENETYWTLSLPMVVTTGGVQLCQCLASIMWQCFSTDVFAIPTPTIPDLSWERVAEMLQAKIRNISSRSLTEDNICHLRERFLGKPEAEDDDISLDQFCTKILPGSADEKNAEFTFWKWFLAIYNLIKTHLQDFWEKRWIEGFLSKAVAERKLLESKSYKPGLFLLRFSDKQIVNCQAKDSVFGKLATSVLLKISGGQRNVEHVDLIDNERLRKMKLGDILLQTKAKKGNTLYRYLYPNMETPFEKFFEGCIDSSKVVVDGYTGVQNAFIADVEQIDEELSKLHLGGKRPSCLEAHSNLDETNSQAASGSEPKRLKSMLCNTEALTNILPGIAKSAVEKAVNELSSELQPQADGDTSLIDNSFYSNKIPTVVIDTSPEENTRQADPCSQTLMTQYTATVNYYNASPDKNGVFNDTNVAQNGFQQTLRNIGTVVTEVPESPCRQGHSPEMASYLAAPNTVKSKFNNSYLTPSNHMACMTLEEKVTGKDSGINPPIDINQFNDWQAPDFRDSQWNDMDMNLSMLTGNQNIETETLGPDIGDNHSGRYQCTSDASREGQPSKCIASDRELSSDMGVEKQRFMLEHDTCSGGLVFIPELNSNLTISKSNLDEVAQISEELIAGKFDNMLFECERETMKGMSAMSQKLKHDSETMKEILDSYNDLPQEIKEIIKAFIKKQPPDKMLELIPLDALMEPITQFLQSLSMDRKKRVIFALQGSMNHT